MGCRLDLAGLELLRALACELVGLALLIRVEDGVDGSQDMAPGMELDVDRLELRARDVGIVGYADGERIGPLPAIFDVLPAALPVVVGPNAKGIR